jgi:5-methylthioadenosine/S-adenosylhomocysteine deaminase
MPVIPYVKKQNLFEAKVLAAHCVHIDDGEIKTLFHHKAGIAHNPSSNLKLASGFAPVTKMIEVGLNVGIGTDGPASNNDLDMEEIRLAFPGQGTGDLTTIRRRLRWRWHPFRSKRPSPGVPHWKPGSGQTG